MIYFSFFFDGKGDTKKLEASEKLAALLAKNLLLLLMNMILHTIRLSTETESTYYTNGAKPLLISMTQLLDAFHIQRTFKNLPKYFLPKRVLELFVNELEEQGVEVFVRNEKIDTKKSNNLSKTREQTINKSH